MLLPVAPLREALNGGVLEQVVHVLRHAVPLGVDIELLQEAQGVHQVRRKVRQVLLVAAAAKWEGELNSQKEVKACCWKGQVGGLSVRRLKKQTTWSLLATTVPAPAVLSSVRSPANQSRRAACRGDGGPLPKPGSNVLRPVAERPT